MNKHLFYVLFALISSAGFSQEAVAPESIIDSSFAELIENSNSFKGYKVVDYDKLVALKSSTASYIAQLKEEIKEHRALIDSQKQQAAKLEADLAAVRTQLKEVTAEKDAITFLGMPFTKSTYKSIMWAVVGILILALILFVVRYQRSHIHTREARAKLQETEKEFESYRTKTLEKEQRMGRQLQDERNKSFKVANK